MAPGSMSSYGHRRAPASRIEWGPRLGQRFPPRPLARERFRSRETTATTRRPTMSGSSSRPTGLAHVENENLVDVERWTSRDELT